jgi:hypothetical protein
VTAPVRCYYAVPNLQLQLISDTVLNDWAALYLSAQTAGNPAILTETLSTSIIYMEQFQHSNISKGIISQPLNITQYRSILDEVLCTAFTEIVVTDTSHP